MSTPEKIEAAGKKKEEGNTLFKAGKYARASKRYEKVYIFHQWLPRFNLIGEVYICCDTHLKDFEIAGCQVYRI